MSNLCVQLLYSHLLLNLFHSGVLSSTSTLEQLSRWRMQVTTYTLVTYLYINKEYNSKCKMSCYIILSNSICNLLFDIMISVPWNIFFFRHHILLVFLQPPKIILILLIILTSSQNLKFPRFLYYLNYPLLHTIS